MTYKDVLEAITDGTIPGSFSADRMSFTTTSIEYADAKGKSRRWGEIIMLLEDGVNIPILDRMLSQPTYKFTAPIPPNFIPKDPSAYTAVIRVTTGFVGGEDRDGEDTIITSGKNLAKANATNCITQAFREAYSKLKDKMKCKRPVEDVAPVASTGDIVEINSTRVPPMLPSKTGDCKWDDTIFAQGVSCQPKYDGHRVICYQEDDHIICYSRNLETYFGLDSIGSELLALKLPPKPSDVTVFFDGELYHHGMSLQDISGLVRAKDGRDKGILKLVIFDVFFNFSSWSDKISSERQAYLAEIFNLNVSVPHPHLELAPIFKVTSLAEAFKKADEFVANGYEGAVIRRDNGKYDYSYNGRHTNVAYKIKRREEHEYKVVGYEKGTRGKAADMMMWRCATEDGKEFSVSINTTNDSNRRMFEHFNNHPEDFEKYFKNRYVNIEYAELSKDGKPLQPKAVMLFRNPPDIGKKEDEDFYIEINLKLSSISGADH